MSKILLNSDQQQAKVISRDAIPALKSIKLGKNVHNLGLLLDFRKNTDLFNFIPDQTRLSASWVHLKPEETLAVHAHPTASMIIVTEGEGIVMGDVNQWIKSGDTVIVPPQASHGFVGKGKEGFWALSLQFEGLGLYEDPENPRVKFKTAKALKNQPIDLVALLEKDQEKHEKKFRKGTLMKLVSSDLIKQKEIQDRLLEALNFWSDWFQRILAARVAMGNPYSYQNMAEEHYAEEMGHNKTLLKMREQVPVTIWDPVMDAAASWFYQRITTGTPEDRTILMHCVLEAASCIFHSGAQSIFPHSHFSLHSELDQEHSKEGFVALRAYGVNNINHLRDVLREGWEMTEHLTGSMARYAKRAR